MGENDIDGEASQGPPLKPTELIKADPLTVPDQDLDFRPLPNLAKIIGESK